MPPVAHLDHPGVRQDEPELTGQRHLWTEVTEVGMSSCLETLEWREPSWAMSLPFVLCCD